VISALIEARVYDPTQVQVWTAEISESVVLALRTINTGYKYAVTCVVMQKGEAGLHIGSTCFWDQVKDGSFSVRLENATMHCIVNVFAMVY